MLKKFATWDDVLAFARNNERIWYHAPLDTRASMVCVVKVYKNGKIRLDPNSRDADPFTADSDHIDRFRCHGAT
jgi:hypothetical protein